MIGDFRFGSNPGWLSALVALGAMVAAPTASAQQPATGTAAAPPAATTTPPPPPPGPAGAAAVPSAPPPAAAPTAVAPPAPGDPAPAGGPPPGPAASPPVTTAPPSPPPVYDDEVDEDTDEDEYYTRYPYRAGQAVPPGYHVEEHGIKGLVIAGAITFGATYFMSLAVAPNRKYLNWLAVPLAGPYVAAERVEDCGEGYYDEVTGRWIDPSDDSDCVYDADATAAMLRLDGFTQATGVALFAVGMLVRRQSLVRDPPPVALRVTPYRVGRNGYGLGVTGRF